MSYVKESFLNSTLILTRKEVEKILDMRRALGLVEGAFKAYAQGRVRMPPKIYIHLNKYNGDFRAMPAYIEGIEASGIKWVNVHPGNKKRALPAVMAVIILSDPKTGFPLAIMDGTYITNMRTGAAGGIAAKYLANKGSSRVALVGCGSQARTQLEALNEVFKIKKVLVFDSDFSRVNTFIKKMNHLGLEIEACADMKGCVFGADIVVTTTPSRKPIIRAEWIAKGTHINAIGADAKGKEELEPLILKKAKVVVDALAQARHSGEINVPLSKNLIKESDIYASIADVVVKKKKGRVSKDEITVFDSTGLAIQDVAVASFIYKEANKRGLGKSIRGLVL